MEFKELKELLERNRSYRRFKQEERISREILAELASLACLCASGRNLQPLKYRLVEEAGVCDSVFRFSAGQDILPTGAAPPRVNALPHILFNVLTEG